MNNIQIKLEKYRRAAHLARFEPVGKPFKEACDLIERMERTLRSVSQYAVDDNPKLTVLEMRKLAGDAINGT